MGKELLQRIEALESQMQLARTLLKHVHLVLHEHETKIQYLQIKLNSSKWGEK